MAKKKLTLNQTWVLCLRMWKWIAKQRKANKRLDVYDLKKKWLENNWQGYIRDNCFFCDYTVLNSTLEKSSCDVCPGRLVNKQFDCGRISYDYDIHPIAFYNKLVNLNRKRKKKK